jgi:hypothetical protein
MKIFKNKKSKEFLSYENEYINNSCEGDIIKLTVLVGYNVVGASKSQGDKYYSSFVKGIARLENNKVKEENVNLCYYLDNTTPLKYLKVKNLTAYDFLVKKIKDRNIYYIIKLIGQSKTKAFNSIVKELSKPLIVYSDKDKFTYDRTLGWYQSKINISNKTIQTMLYPKDDKYDATESLQTLQIIKKDFDNFYNKVLLQCSKAMVVTANAWQEDTEHLITAEEISKRIDKETFDLEISGKDFTIYFDDDDIFYGHVILYNGNIENDTFDATIAG